MLLTWPACNCVSCGVLAGGSLGLMNVFSRYLGGAASDKAASSRGMRGRMWVLLILLLLQGVMCLLVGITHDSLGGTVSCTAHHWHSCSLCRCVPW